MSYIYTDKDGNPLLRNPSDDNVEKAVAAERARCRAIVLKLFGNDWAGNEALRLIDGEDDK